MAGREVDFFWPEERLVVEVDGFEYHGSRDSFERDRRRDRRLVEQGYRVFRVTWRDLIDGPGRVLTSIVQTLQRP